MLRVTAFALMLSIAGSACQLDHEEYAAPPVEKLLAEMHRMVSVACDVCKESRCFAGAAERLTEIGREFADKADDVTSGQLWRFTSMDRKFQVCAVNVTGCFLVPTPPRFLPTTFSTSRR